jgi:uncharacterized hydrophobic protein (TIGR00271 family)
MPSIATSDLTRMHDALLFDGEGRARKLSRFWTLLALSAVIATAGIITDSTATVIGAMIVAPLMTPILGTVLSVVTVDGRNLVRCLLLVVAGAALVVLLAWGMSKLVLVPVDAATDPQVASRVNPRLMDLVAALATGAVGSFALVRSDVSDTLPGVAIAISLVPPLCVVGVTLEAGKPHQASGALLLFVTNVAAILLSGLVVMALYRVGVVAAAGERRSSISSRVVRIAVVLGVFLLVLPLGAESERITSQEIHQGDVGTVAGKWAKARDWEVVGVQPTGNVVRVRAIGPLPIPDPRSLRVALDEAGLKSIGVRLELSPIRRADLPGS